MMGRLFCIMGKSGAGKDAVFHALSTDPALGLRAVVLYTTRPPRAGERDGVDYFFVNGAALDRFEAEGRLLERRRYHTVHGLWQYATVDDGQFGMPENRLLVVTPEAFVRLRARFGAQNTVPLYLEVEDGERLARALGRERAQPCPDYAELCRRYLADLNDFSEEKLADAGIARRFANDDFETCVAQVRAAVLQALAQP